MTEFNTIDRQGKIVHVKDLADGRIVFVSQDGWIERREIITIK